MSTDTELSWEEEEEEEKEEEGDSPLPTISLKTCLIHRWPLQQVVEAQQGPGAGAMRSTCPPRVLASRSRGAGGEGSKMSHRAPRAAEDGVGAAAAAALPRVRRVEARSASSGPGRGGADMLSCVHRGCGGVTRVSYLVCPQLLMRILPEELCPQPVTPGGLFPCERRSPLHESSSGRVRLESHRLGGILVVSVNRSLSVSVSQCPRTRVCKPKLSLRSPLSAISKLSTQTNRAARARGASMRAPGEGSGQKTPCDEEEDV
ncbi:unnamed protein product [Pleuronectes platessa]|uniref:Uncharacterized protein n=1 Tax=Pleuronectes platessa TaxID=8262 RepID=A0A9N7Z5P8_PLEPL|nr:unnamed protein product [Pleuronectes platessa]